MTLNFLKKMTDGFIALGRNTFHRTYFLYLSICTAVSTVIIISRESYVFTLNEFIFSVLQHFISAVLLTVVIRSGTVSGRKS